MKIYILPIDSKLQPDSQKFEYPAGNSDYGVEQDFLRYISTKSLATDSPTEAGWHYLPVFWTRWHLNHNYGKEGLKELQAEVSKSLIDPQRTFTICQYDDGPVIDLGPVTVFLASRKTKAGLDIPLLRNPLKTPFFKPRKQYLASFVGRLDTHPIRKQMAMALEGRDDIMISDGDKGQKFFVNETLRSYTALCPRGYGGSSFRFYEAMQLGIAPLLIGDIDTRPFKKYIAWDSVSFYIKNAEKLPALLDGLDKKRLKYMGSMAKKTYMNHLQYGKWGDYVIKELETTS
ncbi:MAG: exostosin family protein [Candidatus Saccharimonadales bacterium]